ncbi:MAG TPA: ectonucleotide pyrophosphatase/phosphodiesterase, partial [Gemmatimonadaceae bacterium]|nr:ectonucleotide pyrophosphatase/phosphodiesterase [Gemmatimonadaceae bacterium]
LVMISLDGLHPDYIRRADSLGAQIPTLRALVREGARASVRGVLPTVTYPTHATIVTGVSPARHGITFNTTFDPLDRNDGGWFWYASDLRVPALWDVARRRGLKTGAVHWPVSVGAAIDFNVPQIWRRGTADDRKLIAALATPGLLTSLEGDLGPYADGIDESIDADENRARFVIRLMERERPDVIWAYFTALDHEQHETAPFSAASLKILERIDRIVGGVVQSARKLSDSRVHIVVVSDHGHALATRELALGVALRREGWIRYASDSAPRPRDWSVSVWNASGSAGIIVRDTTDVALVRRVGDLLSKLASDTAHGIARVLTRAEARGLGGMPDASFVVSMRAPYRVSGVTRGALVRNVRPGGTHGFPPDVAAMNATFIVAGPGVRAGVDLGTIDMRDIAPTVAALLGLSMPNVEGKNVLARP